MQNRLGFRYTSLLINCNHQTHGENSVIRSTVNLAFRRIQPKITKKSENTTRYKEKGKVEIGKVLKIEVIVNHYQHNSRGEILSAKLNAKK